MRFTLAVLSLIRDPEELEEAYIVTVHIGASCSNTALHHSELDPQLASQKRKHMAGSSRTRFHIHIARARAS